MAAVRSLTSHLVLLYILFLSRPPTSISVTEDMALLEFKESLGNTGALDSSWKQGKSPCERNNQWVGVICSEETVMGLNLMSLNLSGVIDTDALVSLQGLRVLSFENNSFSGPLPHFNKLGALKALYLHANKFSGEIPPDSFKQMGSLKKLWLSDNKLSGKIPETLDKLTNLMELHLENNEFLGSIPSIAQPSLTEIDLSNNKLQGEIPSSMSKFGAKPFQGNPELCGQLLGKDCKEEDSSSQQWTPNNEPINENKAKESNGGSAVTWVVLGLIVAVLLVTIFIKKRRREDNFNVLGKENLDEVVPVHMPSSKKRSSSSRRGNDSTHSSWRRTQSGRTMSDLVMVNAEKGTFGLPDLMKAAAEVLGNGGLGSAYKAVMTNGLSVVVKRLREMNKLNRDGFDYEMRRLGSLRHPNILPILAFHYRKEEKLLVSEFVPKGSLLYLLHGDRGISHGELNWPIRLKIIQGVAHGMEFLHSEFSSCELPHGNLKSSNILLTSNNEPLLTDYALYPLINSTQTAQYLLAYKSPEAILYQQVSPKSDVYCLGIIILEIITGKFPSQYLNNQKGGTDLVQWTRSAISEKRGIELIDPEIAHTTNSLPQMAKLLHIGAACTESDHDRRIDMNEAIKRIEDIHA